MSKIEMKNALLSLVNERITSLGLQNTIRFLITNGFGKYDLLGLGFTEQEICPEFNNK